MAYNEFAVLAKDAPFDDGRVRAVVEFYGNAGEATKRIETIITKSDTVESKRLWADQQAVQFSGVKTIADQLVIGQRIAVRALAGPPAPTAKEIWQAKVNRYLAGKDLGLTGATAVADLAALKADIEATYLSAYL